MAVRTEKNLDGSEVFYTDFPLEEEKLFAFFRELFLEHGTEVVFGPCIDGAVFEIKLSERPKDVTSSEGYLTVDTGPWHFHLCIGRPKTASEELARRRRATRAAFFESRNKSCVPRSYGFRMWNGAGDQMITVFFPNPYLASETKVSKPDWSRLALWKELKLKYTGDAATVSEPETSACLDPAS